MKTLYIEDRLYALEKQVAEIKDRLSPPAIVESKVSPADSEIPSHWPKDDSEPEPPKEDEPKRFYGFCQGREYVEADAYDRLKAANNNLRYALAEVRKTAETLRTERDNLAAGHKLLQAERDVLREFVEACSRHKTVVLGDSDEYGIPVVSSISQVAKRCLELADAAKEQ